MNTTLIRNWNERVKKDDNVLFLGDFCFKNSLVERGEGDRYNFKHYREQLNGEITFIKGNHDNNNSTKTHYTTILLEFGKFQFMGVHEPVDNLYATPDFVDIVLCGHVHQHWKWKWIDFPKDRDKKIMINVGVDVWDFAPVKMTEILNLIAKIQRGIVK